LQLLFVCCVKTVQFNKFVTCTQRDGNNQIQTTETHEDPHTHTQNPK